MIIPSCPEAARLAGFRKTNEAINKKFTSSICGVTSVGSRLAPQVISYICIYIVTNEKVESTAPSSVSFAAMVSLRDLLPVS